MARKAAATAGEKPKVRKGSKTTLSEANLADLGAERLAAILLDLAGGRATAGEVLDLAHEPAVAYFEHEANNCFNKKVQVDPSRVRSDTLRTFLGILGAPRCNSWWPMAVPMPVMKRRKNLL